MNIIIEGVDGIGKSTLVEGLANKLNFTVIHNKATTDNTYDYYKKLSQVPSLIQDRSFISECVYQDVFNRTPQFSKADAILLFEFYYYTKIIVLYSSDDKVYTKNNLDEDIQLRENQVKINSIYRSMPYNINTFMFDVSKYQGKPKKLLEDVMEAIK